MVLKFENGFAEQDFKSEDLHFKVSAFESSSKPVSNIIESEIQRSRSYTPEFNVLSNLIPESPGKIYHFPAHSAKSSNIKTYSTFELYEMHHISDSSATDGAIPVSIRLISRTYSDSHVFEIGRKEVKQTEEAGELIEKLINQRNISEKFGLIIGITLGALTLIPSILFSLEWAITLPASIMFFSLPAFVMLRKQLREGHH